MSAQGLARAVAALFLKLREARRRNKGAAAQDRPGAFDGLCERVVWRGAEVKEPSWSGLLALIRRRVDEQGAYIGPKARRREPTFFDVVLKGPSSVNFDRESSLETALDVEFAEEGADFRIEPVADEGSCELYGFFGSGVFAPRGRKIIATIAFSWSDPASPEFSEGDVVEPKLKPDMKAGWRAGQPGLALGFRPGDAPVDLGFPGGAPDKPLLSANDREALLGAVLYLGRTDRYCAPVVKLLSIDPERGAQAVQNRAQETDWWRRDGEWRKISLQPQDAKSGERLDIPLWLRLSRLLGDATLTTPVAAAAAAAPGKARFLVRGLLAPELRRRGLGELFEEGLEEGLKAVLREEDQADPPMRWAIEFEARGRPRTHELDPLTLSLVADRADSMGLYRHQDGRWVDGGKPAGGDRYLFDEAGVVVCDLFRRLPGAERRIYRRDWRLIEFVDPAPFGEFSIDAGPARLVAGPTEPSSAGAGEARLGLDWLNRAVRLQDSRKDILGLADYWGGVWDAAIEPKAQAVEIEVRKQGPAGNSMKYEIKLGKQGPLGPLWIEYAGLRPPAAPEPPPRPKQEAEIEKAPEQTRTAQPQAPPAPDEDEDDDYVLE